MDKHVKMFFKYASALEFQEYIEACVKNISYILNHSDTHTHTHAHKCIHIQVPKCTFMRKCAYNTSAYACASAYTQTHSLTHKFSHMHGILNIVNLTLP